MSAPVRSTLALLGWLGLLSTSVAAQAPDSQPLDLTSATIVVTPDATPRERTAATVSAVGSSANTPIEPVMVAGSAITSSDAIEIQ